MRSFWKGKQLLLRLRDQDALTEILPMPLVSDRRRVSDGKDNRYEQALPTHDVLSDFFGIAKDSTSIFEASAIIRTEYVSYINTYSTIFLSFADVKESKRRIVKSIKEQLLDVCNEHACILGRLGMFEKSKFDLILRGLSDLEDEDLEPVDHAISFLMKKCHQYYRKRVVLFIDE